MQKNEVKAIRKKTFKYLGILFLLFLIVYLPFGIIKTNKAFEEKLPFTYSITSEDSSLIGGKYRNQIDVIEVNNSKLRNPISTLKFDNSFNIIIYKINTEKEFSLQRMLHIENTSAETSNGYVYTLIGRDIIYNLWYKNGIIKPIQTIFLTYSGDSLQTGVMNDSIVSYHLLCKNVSVKYSQDEPVDLFISGEEKPFGITSIIPMDLLFIKRNRAVYLLIMTPKSEKESIKPDLLYNIITGN